jgi:hypothetical protein
LQILVVYCSVFALCDVHFASIFGGLLHRGEVLTLHKELQRANDYATLLFCVCDL